MQGFAIRALALVFSSLVFLAGSPDAPSSTQSTASAQSTQSGWSVAEPARSTPAQVPLRACLYVDFDCEPVASGGMSPALAAWVRLDAAEADHDLDAASDAFAGDAEVNDYSGRHATGAAQVRQWLQSGALAEFREHVVGTLEIVGERVTWVDTLASADGSTRPVRMVAIVQYGKIRTLASTDLGPRLAMLQSPPDVVPQGARDVVIPLLLGMLVPVIGWVALHAALSLTPRAADVPACGEDGPAHPSLVALRELTKKRRRGRLTGG